MTPSWCSKPRACLRDEPDIHFLLSGWGVGYERLKQLQSDDTASPM